MPTDVTTCTFSITLGTQIFFLLLNNLFFIKSTPHIKRCYFFKIDNIFRRIFLKIIKKMLGKKKVSHTNYSTGLIDPKVTKMYEEKFSSILPIEPTYYVCLFSVFNIYCVSFSSGKYVLHKRSVVPVLDINKSINPN